MTRALRFASILLLAAPLRGQGNQPANQPSASESLQSVAVEVVKAVPAAYPAAALAGRIQGAVPVSVVISPDGNVTHAEAAEGDPLLQAAAVVAAKQWKFKAGRGSQDVSVKCWAEVNFDFESQTGDSPVLGTLVHAEEFPRSMRVSEAVMRARALRTIEPVYPRKTIEAKLQGTVVLDLSVGPDGKVRDVRLLSGPPELAEPMVKAVRQWEFQPYQFLSEDIDVETRLTRSIKLSLNPTTVFATPDEGKALLWLTNPPGIRRGVCLHTVKAAYPAVAKDRGLYGPVLVAVVITEDGTVRGAKAIRGDESLWKAAIDAAKQWRYAPSTLKGRPVEVHDILTVEFE